MQRWQGYPSSRRILGGEVAITGVVVAAALVFLQSSQETNETYTAVVGKFCRKEERIIQMVSAFLRMSPTLLRIQSFTCSGTKHGSDFSDNCHLPYTIIKYLMQLQLDDLYSFLYCCKSTKSHLTYHSQEQKKWHSVFLRSPHQLG